MEMKVTFDLDSDQFNEFMEELKSFQKQFVKA